MSGTGSYILGVTCAAVLAAILRELAGKDTMGTLIQYLCGLFVALTVASPLVKLELPEPGKWLEEFRWEGTAAAEDGKMMAADASAALIKEKLETYILDKAAVYHAAPEVSVSLDGSGLPVRISLGGNVSLAVKNSLTQMICNDLGLDEEAVEWAE